MILNDSITSEKKIRQINSTLVNKLFSNTISVVVNKKIPILYKDNNILLKTTVIGHSINLDKTKFKEKY